MNVLWMDLDRSCCGLWIVFVFFVFFFSCVFRLRVYRDVDVLWMDLDRSCCGLSSFSSFPFFFVFVCTVCTVMWTLSCDMFCGWSGCLCGFFYVRAVDCLRFLLFRLRDRAVEEVDVVECACVCACGWMTGCCCCGRVQKDRIECVCCAVNVVF